MASYWKSPYKERTHSDALYTAIPGTGSLVSISSQSYNGLGKTKYGGRVSPQDWFDWAFAINSNNNAKPHAANFRHARAELKGILKLPFDESSVEDGKTGIDTESNKSSRSEIGFSKREKKKVTFDESFSSGAPNSIKFQPHIYTEPLNNRTKVINIMNGFPANKSNSLTKLKKLPSASVEKVLNQQESQAVSKTNGSKCKHNPELRCASCSGISAGNKKKAAVDLNISPELALQIDGAKEEDSHLSHLVASVPQSGLILRDPKSGKRNAQFTETLQQNCNNDTTNESSQEPLKKYKSQWVKTITPLQRKRQYLRHASRQNRMSTNDFSQKKNRLKLGFVNARMKNQVLEDFSKLQISGDGRLVSTKLHEENVSHRQTQNICNRYSKNVHLLPSRKHDAKARPFGESLPKCPLLARSGSAPGRLREDSGQADYCLDKTSQILSWLDDVRSKSHFKARTSRTYASGPTSLL